MKRITTILTMLMFVCMGAWAYSTTSVSSAQDSKGNALVPGAFYRILLPSRSSTVCLMQIDNVYVQAHNGLGATKEYMWKIEEDANGKALISNPDGGYWKFTDYNPGNSKLVTSGTSDDCTHFQMAWYSSTSKTLNLFDPAGGSYSYGGVTCGAVLSNYGGTGNYMGIYNDISDGGSIFKFERFYRTIFTVENTDVNGVAVENYPSTVTINGNITASEYYTNSDNQITSFSTVYGAAYYIGGVEKTAEEVKDAINANTGTLTVTVKPKPFVASTNVNPAYYAIMISGNANSWWQNTNGTAVNCGAGRTYPDVAARSTWIWELKQNSTVGYRIYNTSADKYLGGRTSTGGAFTLGDDASANSFRSYGNGATIKFKDYTNNLWIDRSTVNSIGQPYAHTSGQQITFLRMYKVTFSEALTVNSVGDVTTIYVKSDGTDVITLPSDKIYSINGSEVMGHADAEAAISACSSDLTIEVSENTTKDVTYILKWSDGTTINAGVSVETELLSPASEFVPSSFVSDFTTLSYSIEEISDETDEVTVTATWNGPFEISPALSAGNFASGTKWYVVDMHSNIGDYTWQYDASSQEIQTPVIAKDAYASLTDANLWCFIGNPYDGFKIYNKAAGPTKTIRKATSGNTVSYMSTDDDHNSFVIFNGDQQDSGYDIIPNAYCFKLDGDDYYLNQGSKLQGYNKRDQGSCCRFFPPGKYHLAAMNSWNLDAPLGAVGTKAYISTEDLRANLINARDNIKEDPFSVVGNFVIMNTILNPVRDSEFITLTDGYYRVLSAMKGFNNTAAWYYNPATSTDHITWAKAATTAEQQANSIFKFTANEDKWNIYSPNAQKYMIHDNTAFQAQTGTIGDEAGDVTITSIGSAQYTLMMNVQTIHCNGHNNGNNSTGTLINYNANGLGQASTWYIVKVDNIEVALNGPIDGYYYATLYLPFDVTISGATAYTLAVVGDWAVPRLLADNKVPAGTAVLLKGTSATATATINTGDAFSTSNVNALQGTYVPKDFALTAGATADYFLGVYSGAVGFYHWSGTTLAANRAYLPASAVTAAEARGFAINWDDEVTGIGDAARLNVKSEMINDKQVFDLQGRRVENPQRGLYIVNGRKVVVK